MPDETLGEILHQARRDAGMGRPRPWPPSDWAARDAVLKALDEAMAEAVAAEVRARFGQVLHVHYLAGISCDRARHEDNPVCACSRVFLGWHPSIGAARDAWISHVLEVLSSEEGNGHGGS